MQTDKYIGQFLDNRYEIIEKIGSGGMADVYKARCHRLNRMVAVKILKSELAQDAEFRRRFYAESQAVAMLSHPNIVSVYDVSCSGDVEYIVMELIEGITLKQYINRKGALSWKETLHFTTQTVKALQHAHSRGIIHRDIKPHNIMILKDGSVKVADFGIARLLTTQQNTLTQEALGSVHYISPEQAKGGHVDTRSDLYSLGVVMYEMLTGRLPFEGDSPVSIAIQHISSIPLMPREINPDIPVGLEEITVHAMESNLDERYASADEMLHDLEEFRKNPDIVFDYQIGAPSIGLNDDEQTRAIPVGAAATASAPVQKRKPQKTSKKKNVTKDEYSKNRKKAGKTSVLVGVFCIALVIILLCVFMWKYLLKSMLNPDEEYVTIPQFISQNIDDVKNNEEYKKYYNFEVEYETNEEFPDGYILEQNPAPDREVVVRDTGIDIKLTVSSGEAENEVKMPSLQNKEYREAETMIRNLQLDLEIVMTGENDDQITEGYVIDQYPAAGELLTKNGTVYITYSLGPKVETTNVPTLTGLSESQAIARLEACNLSYKVEQVENDAAAGTVIFQSYLPGEEVEIHTRVTIQVSKGPAEPPQTEPDPGTEPDNPGTTTDPEPTPEPEPTPTPDNQGGTTTN